MNIPPGSSVYVICPPGHDPSQHLHGAFSFPQAPPQNGTPTFLNTTSSNPFQYTTTPHLCIEASEAIDYVNQVKRKYDEGASADDAPTPRFKQVCVDIRYLKDFPKIYPSEEGFAQLLKYIDHDMDVVYTLIKKNPDLFAPFVRSQTIIGVEGMLNNICRDICDIRQADFPMCKYEDNCKFRECCAFVHPNDIFTLERTFRSMQLSTNKFIDRKMIHFASAMMRSLTFMENALWMIYSRKQLGRARGPI